MTFLPDFSLKHTKFVHLISFQASFFVVDTFADFRGISNEVTHSSKQRGKNAGQKWLEPMRGLYKMPKLSLLHCLLPAAQMIYRIWVVKAWLNL